MKVSFIGLGNMGKPLAERVLAGGCPLAVWTGNRQAAALAYVEKASEAGLGEEDMSAIYKVLDR